MVNLSRRFADFIRTESASGVVMLCATALALLAANTGAAPFYQHLIHLPLGVAAGSFHVEEPLAEWVKDALMVLFFLLVGLELKRELLEGVLSDRRQVLLPLVAAIGGMAAPAAIFLLVNHGLPAHLNGWAIPSATDIAFALCILLLVSRATPPALKIFLLAIAIFDDLGAILIIAAFYSKSLALLPLAMAVGACGLLYLLNRLSVMRLVPYLLVGTGLAVLLYHAGIHTTIAGVITGMAVPMRDDAHRSRSPVNHCMHLLHPWVSFGVLPLFAFTAAGVDVRGISLAALGEPLTLGVLLGLFIGKQVGIFGSSWLLIKTRLVAMPEDTHWRHLYAVALLAGIGFTMSLFIGALAFEDAGLQMQAKLGVFAGSTLAALAGWLVLRTGK